MPRLRSGSRFAVLLVSCLLFLPAVVHATRNCAQTSVGLTPLTELGTGTYRGFQGGLYPGGSNVRPAAHEAAGLARAARVVPLDASGFPDPVHGKIVLLTLGMSNLEIESQWLVFLTASDPLRDPRVIVVNGGTPGVSAKDMANLSSQQLSLILSQLSASGVTPQQVQVLWYKEANEAPVGPFPQHAQTLQSQNTLALQGFYQTFPNTQICYVSTRIYGGYSVQSASPEPVAYETGFAYKWLVEAQINGDPELNFDPRLGPVKVPWITWGPYLWADGTTPRADGLTWACGDFQSDGMHPAFIGAIKVATLVMKFLETDPTSVSWYSASVATSAETVTTTTSKWSVGSPRPNPFVTRLSVPVRIVRATRVAATVYSLAGRRVRTLEDGELAAGVHEVTWDGRDEAGRRVVAGTYLVRIRNGSDVKTVKTTLLR